MKLSDAEKQWVEAKQAAKAAEALLAPAREVLLEHFRKTGRTTYKRVLYASSTYQRLDTDAVRVELADRIATFERPTPRETLSLLAD